MRARLPVDGRYNPQSPFLQAAPGVKALKALRASYCDTRWEPSEDAVY